MKVTKPSASRYVNAVCVAVEDRGVVSTRYGKKPMLEFTFEIDELNEFGGKRRLTRLFHNHTHPLSAVSTTVKKWCDRNLGEEEKGCGIEWQSFVNHPACLRIEPGTVKGDRCYENITDISPLKDVELDVNTEPQENN